MKQLNNIIVDQANKDRIIDLPKIVSIKVNKEIIGFCKVYAKERSVMADMNILDSFYKSSLFFTPCLSYSKVINSDCIKIKFIELAREGNRDLSIRTLEQQICD